MMEVTKLLKRKLRAQSDGNRILLTSVCIDLANIYMQEGRYECALKEFTAVADAYKELKNEIDYARANRMIGEAYMQLREFDKALKHQKIHLDVARLENNKLEEQRALAAIGHTYLTRFLDGTDNSNKTDLNLASKSFMKSFQICESLTGTSKIEHMDITTRLLANLGVVEECLGNYDKGVDLITRSIKLCKDHDLYEQLERGYTFLGSLFVRKGEYNSAIEQYNLAIDVAGRLPEKVQLMAASLAAKADILIKLSDFCGAKNVLLKAYKLKTSNIIEAKNIKSSLKVAAAMCYAEDSILVTADEEHKKKKSLYEKLGDGACYFKNYSKAIEYYQKMLEESVKDGDTGKELSSCYISLAQTYSDNKQYNMALEYFQREYELCKDNLKERVETILNIIETMKLMGKDFQDIENDYKLIIKQCSQEDNSNLKLKVLKKYMEFLLAHQKMEEACLIEKQLSVLKDISSDEESELSDDECTPNIGNDVDTDNITDVSDDNMEEKTKIDKTRKRREKGLVFKRNNKGETPLHTACIDGNATLVKHLLEQGHPVNIRDNCGWLPIHEASICGHIEIVEMLLNKGATINDRGGTHCRGITPLYDAASNGHLEVMELLLNRGASCLAKTDDGDTAVNVLKQWRKSVTLEEEQSELYRQLVERMNAQLEKSVHASDQVLENRKCDAFITEEQINTTHIKNIPGDWTPYKTVKESPIKSRSSSKTPTKSYTSVEKKVGSIRRNVEGSPSTSEYYMPSTSDTQSEYQNVMKNLRHRRSVVIDRKRKSDDLHLPAYVNSGEDLDDWLEDDIGKSVSKKRKTKSISNLINTSNTREILSRSNNTDDIISIADDTNKFYEGSSNSLMQNSSNNRRKTQTSLLTAGFSRLKTDGDITESAAKTIKASNRTKKQSKITNFTGPCNILDTDSTVDDRRPTDMQVKSELSNIQSVDVKIEGRLYRVPILASEIQIRTIHWLAEEAAKRYFKREGTTPVLELETKNGAILADDDLISMLFPAGSSRGEEVHAKVLQQSVPQFTERYEEACLCLNMVPDENLQNILKDASLTLNLADLCLRDEKLTPICRALNRQTNLLELNLSGNVITDESILILCAALPTLRNLSVLNLSMNHLKTRSLKSMCDLFSMSDHQILEKLCDLDLSCNPLGDDSLPYLTSITSYLKLKRLSLSNVDFTNTIFQHFSNKNLKLWIDDLISLDISYNKLDKLSIVNIVSWLNPCIVEELNISHNDLSEDGLISELAKIFQSVEELQLRKLELAKCRIGDWEIFELLKLLTLTKNLDNLNLSFNKNISSISLRRLLNHYPSPAHLDLHGCDNILKYFRDSSEEFWTFSHKLGLKQIKTFTLTMDSRLYCKEYDILCRMWKNEYGDCFSVKEIMRNVLQFKVL